jgi:hypothetical protein
VAEWGGMITPIRLLAGAVTLALAALPAAARPADVAGWQAARWGMTDSDLVDAFGDVLAQLPTRRDYGGAYAARYLPDVALGSRRWRALFQMNAADGTLQQVLLEPHCEPAAESPFAAARAALTDIYGPPDGRCATPGAGGAPRAVELWWTFATTTVRLAAFDFYTSRMIFREGRTDRPPVVAPRDPDDPLDQAISGANARFLPRRTLVRYHPTGRADLASATCPPDAR